jgi:hypothetical protein
VRTRLWLLALAAGLFVLWRGSGDVFWHDFGLEAWPAFEALGRGDLGRFLDLSPVYAGSMTLRAPLAYAASAVGANDNWVFRAGALPGVAAMAWLAVHLAGRARRAFEDRVSWLLVVVVTAAGPLVWKTYEYGHPEDVLAAAACVGAVLLAGHGRPLLSGVALGVAIASKQWALLAVAPAVLAAPRRDLRMLIPVVGIPAAAIAPMWFADIGGFTSEARGVAGTGGQFHPHTILWPLAQPGPDLPSGEPGAIAPAWLSPLPKPAILVVGLALSLVFARVRRERTLSDALLLLAVVLLARCLLDPWNLVYYHLPVVLALAAWEVYEGRRPLLALAVTALAWISFLVYDARAGYGPFLVYCGWALPLLVALGAASLTGASVSSNRSTPRRRLRALPARGHRAVARGAPGRLEGLHP